MSCEEKKCCKEVEANMVGMGFDPTEVIDFVTKYGQDILTVISDGIQMGLSKEFLVEILTKFGPLVLEWLIDLLNKKDQGTGVDATLSNAMLSGSISDVILDKLLDKLQDMLPELIEKYTPVVVNALIAALMKYLGSTQTAPTT